MGTRLGVTPYGGNERRQLLRFLFSSNHPRRGVGKVQQTLCTRACNVQQPPVIMSY